MFYLNFFAFFAFVSKLLRAIVNPILTFVNRKYSGHIPEHGNSLLDMNIAELTMKIKTQEVSYTVVGIEICYLALKSVL